MSESDRHLAGVSFLSRFVSQGENGAELIRMFEHYVAALGDFEAVNADERRLWRQRMTTARSDDRRTLTAYAAPVREQLEQALRDVPAPVESGSDEAVRLRATLVAAQALGVLGEDDVREWGLRIVRKLIVPPSSPPDPREERRRRAVVGTEPGELRRVIPGPPDRRAGLRVASVQVYEGATAVRWHFVSSDESWPRRVSRFGGSMELADDHGTEYFGSGAGGSSMCTTPAGEAVVIGQDRFVPAPPSRARTLIVNYAGEQISVDLAPDSR